MEKPGQEFMRRIKFEVYYLNTEILIRSVKQSFHQLIMARVLPSDLFRRSEMAVNQL